MLRLSKRHRKNLRMDAPGQTEGITEGKQPPTIVEPMQPSCRITRVDTYQALQPMGHPIIGLVSHWLRTRRALEEGAASFSP